MYVDDSGMNKQYWGEAIITAAYTRNMISSKSNQSSTPYEEVFKKKPDFNLLQIFGSTCYAHVPKATRKKLDNTGIKCRFLGHASDQKGFRLLVDGTNRVITSRSVTWESINCSNQGS